MGLHSALVVFIAFLRLLTTGAITPAGTEALTGSLSDTGCFKTRSDGGWGFCGPASCKDAYITCPSDGAGPPTVDGVTGTYTVEGSTQITEGTCGQFLDRTTDADISDWNPKGGCDSTCTQVTTGICDGEFLAKVLVGTGVKYAYCNDKWLVIQSSGEPSVYTPNLDDVPFPPAKAGTSYRTGMKTLDLTRSDMLFYPLSVTDLSTSAITNNLGVYDVTTGVGAYSYLIDGSTSYGIPSDNGVGMGVNGQMLFPVYNNNAEYASQKCEMDSCSNHIGQGGGQPHIHGDPFGDQDSSKDGPDRCLYGPSNYSSGSTGHPPIIGFAFDGHLIYGRYLDSSAPGFAAPTLDVCGGHAHTNAGTDEHGFDLKQYHYHTQVFDATCPARAKCSSGEAHKVTTTGPYQCFKADLSAAEGSSALLVATADAAKTYRSKKEMSYRCCDMTDYYALTGLDVSGDVKDSSTCSAPTAPTNGEYPSGSACATGGKLYSGNQCRPSCGAGYCVNGTTRCVKGVLTETATCVAGDCAAAEASESTTASTTASENSATASSTTTKGAVSAALGFSGQAPCSSIAVAVAAIVTTLVI
eukprot:TRINITY_DN74650_c0_g1_i1.p1 TRINITY_DN74650_c0_g1~~TRINITY_DN74650_c0_g1_i1.p1  ORF type:complete len:582 (-),score=48.68 TRINITY_DN74650_c0_g1_i1:312-2057(-)